MTPNIKRNPNVDYSLIDFCSTVPVVPMPAQIFKQVQMIDINKGLRPPIGKRLTEKKNNYLITASLLN
jgi:hypothetical protein